MKKIFAILLVAALLCMMTACGGKKPESKDTESASQPELQTEAQNEQTEAQTELQTELQTEVIMPEDVFD